MKYLECGCCGFLAVIPEKDDHEVLSCPFCLKSGCDAGYYELCTTGQFMELAKLKRPTVLE